MEDTLWDGVGKDDAIVRSSRYSGKCLISYIRLKTTTKVQSGEAIASSSPFTSGGAAKFAHRFDGTLSQQVLVFWMAANVGDCIGTNWSDFPALVASGVQGGSGQVGGDAATADGRGNTCVGNGHDVVVQL